MQRSKLTRLAGVKLSLLAGVVMIIQGCTPDLSTVSTPADSADSCNRHYAAIAQANKSQMDEQINNATAGALIGGVLGAAVSGRQDRAKGIVLGALAGGLTGYAGTYYRQKAEGARDRNALLASVNRDARAESAVLGRTGSAIQALRDCRTGQVTQLASKIRTGKVDKAAGRRELAVVQRRIEADNRLINAAFGTVEKRVDTFVSATAAASEVNRASYLAANDAAARRARSQTPQVAAVSTRHTTQKSADEKMRQNLNQRVSAIEMMLG